MASAVTTVRSRHGASPYTSARLSHTRWNGIVSPPGMTNISQRLTAVKTAQTGTSTRLASEGSIRDEAVAHIPHRLDLVRVELGPQPPDVDVHDVAARIERVAPDIGEQLLPGAHPALALHQVQQ